MSEAEHFSGLGYFCVLFCFVFMNSSLVSFILFFFYLVFSLYSFNFKVFFLFFKYMLGAILLLSDKCWKYFLSVYQVCFDFCSFFWQKIFTFINLFFILYFASGFWVLENLSSHTCYNRIYLCFLLFLQAFW